MLETLFIVGRHGRQTIPDVTTATLPSVFRGRPVIADAACQDGCDACITQCPTSAISIGQAHSVHIDLGACVFCGECADLCPTQKIRFTNDHRLSTTNRNDLVIAQGVSHEVLFDENAIRSEVRSYFGRSLKLRQISAGGCNACELELNACGNVNFDMGRYGIDFVASPRHADGVVITGPITANMSAATALCYEAVPDPRIIVLTGACAISGGVFEQSTELRRTIAEQLHIDLYVPGCPPHPLTFINGILQLIRKRRS